VPFEGSQTVESTAPPGGLAPAPGAWPINNPEKESDDGQAKDSTLRAPPDDEGDPDRLARAARCSVRGWRRPRGGSTSCGGTCLPVRPYQGPEAREAIVAAGSDVLAAMVHELEAAAMEIFGPYNAGVSRLGRAAAEKAEVA
jgi:hypothetical protein